jgi:hypothetical protein
MSLLTVFAGQVIGHGNLYPCLGEYSRKFGPELNVPDRVNPECPVGIDGIFNREW